MNADPLGGAEIGAISTLMAMALDSSTTYPGRGVAVFLTVWGIGTGGLSVLSLVLGQFPASFALALAIALLVLTSLLAAHAIRSRSTRLALASYAAWSALLFGLFLYTVYDPGRPQDLVAYSYALAFLGLLGFYLARQLRQ